MFEQLSSKRDKEPPQQPVKSTKFDRIIADFVGKRYGAGQVFYGRRTSQLSEAEYQQELNKNRKPTSLADAASMELKNNAILLIGDPNLEVLQWVAFELLEKGFSVRLCCERFKDAVDVFGIPGFNIDIVIINKESNEKEILRCVMGIQAIICAPNFFPSFQPFSNELTTETSSYTICKLLLDQAESLRRNKKLDLAKVIYVSRFIPSEVVNRQGASTSRWLILAKLLLLEDPGSINVADTTFDMFRQRHGDFEALIRNYGFDYVIVRAPGLVLR